MGTLPCTPFQSRLAAWLGCTITALALLISTAPDAQASNVAEIATRLAADTQRLVDARADLASTDRQFARVEAERRALWVNVQGRLVAIYKHGSNSRTITRVAAGESMGDVGERLDALDQVAEHDARSMRRWKRLDARLGDLRTRQTRLRRTVRTTEGDVARAREELSVAERAAAKARREAAKARREAERMARVQDSLLLPKVLNPESEAAEAGSIADAKPDAGGGAEPAPDPEPVQPMGFVQSGVASMYANSFTGQETANGERYDPGAFTAAHPSLPFGTWVTVSGPGGAVAVRINDRGPFVGGRIIDLSQAAATAIGLPGIGSVSLSVAS